MTNGDVSGRMQAERAGKCQTVLALLQIKMWH